MECRTEISTCPYIEEKRNFFKTPQNNQTSAKNMTFLLSENIYIYIYIYIERERENRF